MLTVSDFRGDDFVGEMAFHIPAVWYWVWVIPVSLGGIFIWRYQRNKTRLSNGLWFSAAFYTFLAALAMTILGTNNGPLIAISLIAFVVILMAIGVTFALQAFLLLWNAWIVWHREQHTVANMLTLGLGVFFLILPWLDRLAGQVLPRPVDAFLVAVVNLSLLYVAFWFYNYLTMLVIYQFNRPRLNQDYIVVLGAGLLNGNQVSPLLKQRIDRGLRFYQRQLTKTGHPVKMIFSGGQGSDETVAEGQAMRDYAISQGLPADDAIAETRSRTTLENMQFSRALMTATARPPRVIFVSNNYHIYRAGMIAQQAGLRADGIGSRTAHFFLPNAVLREYIAVFVRNKRWHLVAFGGILVMSGLLAWL